MPRNHHKNAEEKVLEDLKTFLKGNETLVIGVSGGSDSVFLLNCLVKFKEKNKNLKIIVAHINHMLRGREAEKDMEFVEKLCKKLQVTFKAKEVDVETLSKTTKSSIEESGREIRYQFFEELFEEFKANYCLTAHHSDDNLETIMLNFVRGASVKGLSGMKRFSTKKSGLRIFRPLLCVSKDEIMDFLTKNHTEYRTDQSNLDTEITRNFLRHKVIPLLKKLNPNLSQTVLKNASTFNELHKYLSTEVAKWIEAHGEKKTDHHPTSFPVLQFAPLPSSMKKEIILTIYRNLTGDAKNIENKHIEEVVEIIDRNIGGKKKSLGKHTVEINRGRFIFNQQARAQASAHP